MPAASASLRIPSITSETDLVARCLAEVRAAAKLDDVPVLETMSRRMAPSPKKQPRSVPPPPPPPLPARALATTSPVAAIVMAPLPGASGSPSPRPVPRAREPLLLPLPAPSAARAFAAGLQIPTSTTMPVGPRRRSSSGFAVFLCAVIALVTGALAVVRSPLRHREPVARTVVITTAAAHEAASITLDVLFFGER